MIRSHEASFYLQNSGKSVTCFLCPNKCNIQPGKIGKCNVRENRNGKLYVTNYGLTTPGTRDPIEKKPLYHFLPGTCAYSYGSVGCNLNCQFCQNYHIARAKPEEMKTYLHYLSPENAAKEAVKSGCKSVAYTYNEPIIWYEWVLDTSKIVKEKGLQNILVTNGFIEEAPLKELLPSIDAANVDYKGDKRFYKELCRVSNKGTVQNTCKIMYEKKVHLEITNLIIPTKNDSEEQLLEMIKFVLEELGPEVPLHFSRYYPNYKLDIQPTPVETLIKARNMALDAGLQYVYLGNVRDDDYSNTYCKECEELLINRHGYSITIRNLTEDSFCKKCNAENNIILK